MGRSTSFADTTRASLLAAAGTEPSRRFDPSTVDDLPDPARRLLSRALPAGVPLATGIELTMLGEIKLGTRWLSFRAKQVLRAGVGFVWAPVVGGRFLRFTGADALGPDGASVEFRLRGRIPVVRATGPDVVRSARGRLAAETVAWLPQALTPQLGARWAEVDADRASVTIDAAGQPTEVEVEVDASGQLTGLALQRWNDSAKPPALGAFGGSVHGLFTTAEGVAIADGGSVGWDWGTARQTDGEFFHYTVNSARFLDP